MLTEDRIDLGDALSDPAHDGNSHRVAESFVARTIGGQLAAVLDQCVIVGESLQALALARCQATHGHLRRHDSVDSSALATALKCSSGTGRRSKLVRPGY